MNIESIRDKYKDIIDSKNGKNKQENSENQWEEACIKFSQHKNSILTQSQFVNIPCNRLSKQEWLNLKQKLAQCLATIKKKDIEILQLKQQIIKSDQLAKFHERQIQQLKQIIDQKNIFLIQQKAAHKSTQDNFKISQQNVEVQMLDKQLQNRQITYYKSQIQTLQTTVANYNKKLKDFEIQIKIIKQLKKQNERLKQDIHRLRDLLSETQKYKKLATQIQYKHYIKKLSTEKENWVSENIVNNVQSFLKKHKIGSGNKQYTNALVKFVDKCSQSTASQARKRTQKTYSSRIRQMQRRHNYSLGHSMNDSSFIPNSCNYKNKMKKKHFRNITQSSILSKAQFGLSSFSGSVSIKNLCIRILNQIKQKIHKQLSLKEISKQRISIIISWAIQSIVQSFTKEKELYKTTKVNKTDNVSKHQF